MADDLGRALGALPIWVVGHRAAIFHNHPQATPSGPTVQRMQTGPALSALSLECSTTPDQCDSDDVVKPAGLARAQEQPGETREALTATTVAGDAAMVAAPIGVMV